MSRDSFVSILRAWMRRENLVLRRTSDQDSALLTDSEDRALLEIVDLVLDTNSVFNSIKTDGTATLDMPADELKRLVTKCVVVR